MQERRLAIAPGLMLVGLLYGACSEAVTPEPSVGLVVIPPGPPIPRDPAGVYAAIIEGDETIPVAGGTSTLRIVQAETVTVQREWLGLSDPAEPAAFWDRFYPRIEGGRSECLDELLSVMGDAVSLPTLQVGGPGLALEVWPGEQWARYMRAGAVLVDERDAEFRERYPHSAGIFGFSRVGFSEDGRQALVYVTRWQGFLYGDGRLVLLAFDEDRGWVQVSWLFLWLS